MTAHGLCALAAFAGGLVAASWAIGVTVAPNIARIRSALAGQGAD